MLTESDRAVLDEAYRSISMGTQTISTILPKVTDEKMALELNRQGGKYSRLEQKVTGFFSEQYEAPRGYAVDKAKVWAGIQKNTLRDCSKEHIAELMIRENTMAATELLKSVKANQQAKRQYCEIAEEILNFQENSIERFKAYLK